MKKTGYKEMLRERCPKLVNYALKWCKSKEAWINHVYDNWIWFYVDNQERLKATRSVLGMETITKNGKTKTVMHFKFEDTIAWGELTENEFNSWKAVSGWVSWFCSRYQSVENDYEISKKVGKPIEKIKLEIMTTHLRSMCPTNEDDAETRQFKNKKVNEFVDFLIDCFENRI